MQAGVSLSETSDVGDIGEVTAGLTWGAYVDESGFHAQAF